jgi:predicted nuclease of predicted toxin-antitoxin system
MKFLIDAQLPFLLAEILTQKGFEILHTNQLPNKDKTSDNEIRELSLKDDYIIITKDSDFMDSFIVHKIPKKLLIVTTGNIKNKELLNLFRQNFVNIAELFNENDLIELNNIDIIVHG